MTTGGSYSPTGPQSYGLTNDFWVFDTEKMTWKEIQLEKDKNPGIRLAHGMMSFHNKLYFFGGGVYDGAKLRWLATFNDVWIFDPSKLNTISQIRYRTIRATYRW